MFRFAAVVTAALVLLVGLPVNAPAAPEPHCDNAVTTTDGGMAFCLDADLDTTWIEDVR